MSSALRLYYSKSLHAFKFNVLTFAYRKHDTLQNADTTGFMIFLDISRVSLAIHKIENRTCKRITEISFTLMTILRLQPIRHKERQQPYVILPFGRNA